MICLQFCKIFPLFVKYSHCFCAYGKSVVMLLFILLFARAKQTLMRWLVMQQLLLMQLAAGGLWSYLLKEKQTLALMMHTVQQFKLLRICLKRFVAVTILLGISLLLMISVFLFFQFPDLTLQTVKNWPFGFCCIFCKTSLLLTSINFYTVLTWVQILF